MSNKELAAVVAAQTGTDVETVEAVIRVHQNKFPGSWQDWTTEGRTTAMVRLMQAACKARETAPERIVQMFG